LEAAAVEGKFREIGGPSAPNITRMNNPPKEIATWGGQIHRQSRPKLLKKSHRGVRYTDARLPAVLLVAETHREAQERIDQMEEEHTHQMALLAAQVAALRWKFRSRRRYGWSRLLIRSVRELQAKG
jgi:hypothetical protein